MFKLSLIVSFVILISVSASRAADNSIPVVPGQYSVKTTTSSNLEPETKSVTDEHCISIDAFTPSTVLPDATCTATKVKKSGNKLTFDFACPGNDERPPMTSKTEIVTTKSTFNIKMEIVNTFEDPDNKDKNKVYSMNALREGKRIGDCKQ